jgi:hypothetical protein
MRTLRETGRQAPTAPLRRLMPITKREHGLRAIEAARKALAAQTAAGNDPRRSAVVNRARGDAVSEGHRRNRSWAREHPGQRDQAWFRREVAARAAVGCPARACGTLATLGRRAGAANLLEPPRSGSRRMP